MTLTDETLEDWRNSPVTEFMLDVLSKMAAQNKAALEAELWTNGTCDRESLGRVKTQEDMIENLKEAEAADWNEWHEQLGHSPD